MPNDGGERIDGSYHVSRAARESGQRINWALMCTFLLSFLTHSRQENQLAAALDPEPLKSNKHDSYWRLIWLLILRSVGLVEVRAS